MHLFAVPLWKSVKSTHGPLSAPWQYDGMLVFATKSDSGIEPHVFPEQKRRHHRSTGVCDMFFFSSVASVQMMPPIRSCSGHQQQTAIACLLPKKNLVADASDCIRGILQRSDGVLDIFTENSLKLVTSDAAIQLIVARDAARDTALPLPVHHALDPSPSPGS